MDYFKLEYSKSAYRADFSVYAVVVTVLAFLLVGYAPVGQRYPIVALSVAGLASWSIIEYTLHRFVFHGPAPFCHWHGEHHRRPTALIGTPTTISLGLFILLVFTPSLLLGNVWQAGAFTFGVLVGYLAYAVIHHAVHHWHFDSTWLRRRKRFHAIHHHPLGPTAYYGVTTPFWDHVFGTIEAPEARTRTRDEWNRAGRER